jgi:hypothetical protein
MLYFLVEETFVFSIFLRRVCHAVCFVLDDELLIVIDMGGVLLISLVFFFERLVEPHMLHISPDEKKLLNSDTQLCSEIYMYIYIYMPDI